MSLLTVLNVIVSCSDLVRTDFFPSYYIGNEYIIEMVGSVVVSFRDSHQPRVLGSNVSDSNYIIFSAIEIH